MTPESAGATPFGIFSLADDFLQAARASAKVSPFGVAGPTRLLCYHAAELFLKTHLRSNGMSVVDLRRMQHDFTIMIDETKFFGLVLPGRAVKRAAVIKDRNDYVRVRYMVAEEANELTIQQTLEFANDIREAVRTTLNFNEHGMPIGQPWVAGEPADYLESAGRPIR